MLALATLAPAQSAQASTLYAGTYIVIDPYSVPDTALLQNAVTQLQNASSTVTCT